MNPREQYKILFKEFQTLSAKTDRTEEEDTRLDAILPELEQLEAKIERLNKIEAQGKKGESLTKSAGRVGANEHYAEADEGKGEGGAENTKPKGPLTLARTITESEGWQRYVASGASQQQSVQIGSFRHRSEDAPPEGPMQRYALITGTGVTIPPDQVPGIFMGELVQPTVRDAFSNAPTTSNMVNFIREDVANNVNAAAAFVEGGDTVKAESTLAFDDDEAPVRTIATTVPVTDQIIEDVPGFQALIEGRLRDFLAQAEDDALLNGDGVSPNLKGLLNTTGVQLADATYWAANAVPDAGTSNEDLNRLTASLTLVRETGLAIPSFLMISPAGLDYMLMATDANRNYLAGNPFSTTGIPRFRGLPVIVTNKLADNEAVVGDGRMAAVRDRMAAKVDIGYVDKQFTQNRKTLRAEERLAFAVYRPAAFVHVTLALN